jgi:hypothetical protein
MSRTADELYRSAEVRAAHGASAVYVEQLILSRSSHLKTVLHLLYLLVSFDGVRACPLELLLPSAPAMSRTADELYRSAEVRAAHGASAVYVEQLFKKLCTQSLERNSTRHCARGIAYIAS